MIKLILQHGWCSVFVLYRRIEQDFLDQWQMICKIETEQWHCEWRGLRLLPSPPTACAVWENMVREFWLVLQNRKMSSCCMAFFTVLSCHTCSACAHAGSDLMQKLPVKKQHRLRSQSLQCGSSTPEHPSTVLGNTCRCRSCTPLLAQCSEFCGGLIICLADAAPVECAGDRGPSSFSPSSQKILSVILVV